MMTLRRTPLLPPGRGLGRPSRSSIGASTAARAAGGGAGLLLDGGRGSAALQIAFCQLPPFVMICTGVVATPVEADWWLSPLPIVESLPSTERICDGSRDRLDSWELQLVRGRGLSAPLSYHAFRLAAVQLRVVIIAICRTHHHLKIPLAAITVLPLYHRALVTTVG
jgi:hypothetical protein